MDKGSVFARVKLLLYPCNATCESFFARLKLTLYLRETNIEKFPDAFIDVLPNLHQLSIKIDKISV